MSQLSARGLRHVSTKFKKDVKFNLEQTAKAQRGIRVIAVLFLQPRRDIVVGGQRQTPAALAPLMTRYSLCRRLGGPQRRSGMGAEKLAPHRDSIPGPSSP